MVTFAQSTIVQAAWKYQPITSIQNDSVLITSDVLRLASNNRSDELKSIEYSQANSRRNSLSTNARNRPEPESAGAPESEQAAATGALRAKQQH